MARKKDKANPSTVGKVGIVVAVGALVASVAVTAVVRGQAKEADAVQSTYEDFETDVEQLESERTALAADPAWKQGGKDQGLVQIPVDRAIDLVVRDLKKDPSSATPVDPNAVEADAGADAGDGGDAGEAAEEEKEEKKDDAEKEELGKAPAKAPAAPAKAPAAPAKAPAAPAKAPAAPAKAPAAPAKAPAAPAKAPAAPAKAPAPPPQPEAP